MSTKTQSHATAPEAQAPGGESIEVHNPATGETIGTVPVHDAAAVQEAVRRARAAQAAWGELDVSERCRRLKTYHTALSARMDEICGLLSAEGGKSQPDALIEAASLLVAARYFLSLGPSILKRRRVGPWLMKQLVSYVLYAPRGVVGIISPWNYPYVIPLYESFAAWVAGNAVVLKPSEWTPLVAGKAKEVWDASGMPPDLFQVVHGYGATGSALIEAGVNKIHFTGSVRVGRLVARECGERLLPCTLELGGKAPAIVTEDAPLEDTAAALTWGAFFNCGQTCIGVERVYVVGGAAAPLAEKLAENARALRVGDPAESGTDVGAMVFPGQLEIVRGQVEEAERLGARVLSGGRRPEGPGLFFPPTVLADCTPEMDIMREETFGPALPVMRVESVDEAVRLANESHLGLNAYVFAGSTEEGRKIAERLHAGSVLVGDVVYNYAMPELPFGGIKASGIGRSHGEEGLRAMCEARLISYNRMALLPVTKLLRYPYSQRKLWWLRKALGLFFGQASEPAGTTRTSAAGAQQRERTQSEDGREA
jgi:acyl-CoA reductase-like NAD-dependent aldehyde dehydrogenase